MRSISHKTICLIHILMLFSMVGCGLTGGFRKGSRTRSSPTILKSSDNACQVSLAEGWRENRELHDSAELEAANEPEEMYLIVIHDSKEDLRKMTIEQHSEFTREMLLKSLAAPQVTEPTSGIIDGHPSLQCEIRGGAENLNVVYLHTTVETARGYYQILAWTLSSKYQKNRSKLQEIVESFREME